MGLSVGPIPGGMAHAKRTGAETPATIREKARQLHSIARQLERHARQIALYHGPTRRLAVLHSRGFGRMLIKLRAFAADVEKKAAELD